MAGLIYQVYSSSALVSLGLYHLICTTRNYLKSPHSYSAKPYHPFPPSSSATIISNGSSNLTPTNSNNTNNNSNSAGRFKHLPLYLLIVCIAISLAHQTLVSSDSDPLLKGSTPVHRFTSLQSAAVLFLFLLLSLSLLLSESTSLLPLPSDLFFALASAFFFLHSTVSYSSASVQTSDLQAKCDSLSARISSLSSLLCLLLAFQPRFFVADLSLAASIILQGLWALQTGLSLSVEAFIPEGCHRLLDVVSGVESSTKCDVEDFRLRAIAILDLAFVVHVVFVVVIVMVTYAVIAKGIGIRRLGSYEALPTSAADSSHLHQHHIQMKAMTGTQA